jgi:hypothetical protein
MEMTYLADMEFASDEYFMREALRQARRAYAADEVPCGAIIVRDGEIIARAWNQVEMLKDATAHAEMLAITQAEAAVEDWRLNGRGPRFRVWGRMVRYHIADLLAFVDGPSFANTGEARAA